MSAVLTLPRTSRSYTASSSPPRPWRQQDPKTHQVKENLAAIEIALPELHVSRTSFDGLKADKKVSRVAQHLAELCTVAHPKLQDTFCCAARMTTLNPAIMAKMTRATTWRDVCCAIPECYRQACGDHVISGAITYKKAEPATLPMQPEPPSYRGTATSLHALEHALVVHCTEP